MYKNSIDEKEEPALFYTEKMIDGIFKPFLFATEKQTDFKNQIWYWKEIVKRHLVKFLEVSTEENLIESAQSLLYAYTFSGTREGLIRLAHGIFGSYSLVFVEDDKKPAVLSLTIKNANAKFNTAYASDQKTTLTTNDRLFVLAMLDLKRLIFHDTLNFFKQFLTPGRILEEVKIVAGD